jgi:Glycosyl transferase family 2
MVSTQPSRFDIPFGSPALSADTLAHVCRRANVVGRITLYSLTVFLVCFALSAASSTLWLLTPLADRAWFVSLHRTLLAVVLADGVVLFLMLFVVHRLFVPPRDVAYQSLAVARVHVGLTAYEDEACIGEAVREFKACPEVDKVVVVENNSRDRTYEAAVGAGADAVVTETVPGYGACCMRALAEAAGGADVVILCEGDMTFSANDVKKFLAYLENCDLVLGTRATQELREAKTQMDWLINPANQIVAKLIQTRFWGTRLTDVGCTYRAMRVESYRRLRGQLHVRGNHFSPHMYMEALKMQMRVIEIPVVFRLRAGESKGVGSNKIKAARVALRMLGLLYRV